MNRLSTVRRVIESGLKTGQIGTPVAVRIVFHPTADHGPVERLLAQGLEGAADWLGAKPVRVEASGSTELGQISTLVRFAGGQTALVSAGSSGMAGPLTKVLVFGNRGVLSWEGCASEGESESNNGDAELSPRGAEWLQQVRESLRSGQARELGGERPASGPLNPSPATRKQAGEAKRVSGAVAANTALRKKLAPPYGVLLVAGDYTHQSNYALTFAADKRCRLIGVTDEGGVTPRRHKLNEQLAKTLGIPFLADLGQALAREDVQIVSICAEPMRRGRIAVRAAAAGKHLYLDKSLAGSLADADAIVAAVRKAGVLGHMFSLVQGDPAERVRRVIASGKLGDLTALHFDLTFAKGNAGTAQLTPPRQETAAPEEFELPDSKRELNNIGVYPLVLLLTLLEREVRSVHAVTGNYFFRENQQNNMEDFGQMLLRLEGGVTATVSAGRTGWRSHPSGGLNRVAIVGTTGTAMIDAQRPRVESWADVPPWTAPERDPDDPMGMWKAPVPGSHVARPKEIWTTLPDPAAANDVAHFLDCLETGRQSRVSTEVAAAATEILMAAYRSAATGKTVLLPLERV